MKVIAINGSPRANGNTYTALKKVTDVLEENGIETEIIHIGNKNIAGCKGCAACVKLGKCVQDGDCVNETALKLAEADGMLIGSPVYYAGINGTLKCFLDRVFYTSASKFRFKVGAPVVVLRRGGAIHVYDTINSYFGISEMIQVPAVYWNAVHGAAPGEAAQDAEGMQIMESIGRNMAYILKMKEQSSVKPPEPLQKIKTNFIR